MCENWLWRRAGGSMEWHLSFAFAFAFFFLFSFSFRTLWIRVLFWTFFLYIFGCGLHVDHPLHFVKCGCGKQHWRARARSTRQVACCLLQRGQQAYPRVATYFYCHRHWRVQRIPEQLGASFPYDCWLTFFSLEHHKISVGFDCFSSGMLLFYVQCVSPTFYFLCMLRLS